MDLEAIVVVPGVGPKTLGDCTREDLLALAEEAERRALDMFVAADDARTLADRGGEV